MVFDMNLYEDRFSLAPRQNFISFHSVIASFFHTRESGFQLLFAIYIMRGFPSVGSLLCSRSSWIHEYTFDDQGKLPLFSLIISVIYAQRSDSVNVHHI